MALTARQKRAIELCVTPDSSTGMLPSVTAIMKAVGLSRRRWYYWLEIAEFRAELIKQIDVRLQIGNRLLLLQKMEGRGVSFADHIKLFSALQRKEVVVMSKEDADRDRVRAEFLAITRNFAE